MQIPVLLPDATGVGYAVTLGGLTFNSDSTDDNGVSLVLESLKGWDSPALRDSLTDRPRAHGAYRGDAFYGQRDLELAGFLFSPNGPDALAVARDRLIMETDLTDRDALLTVTQSTTRTALVRRTGRLLLDTVSPWAETFNLALTAADPRRYGTTTRTLTLSPGQTADGINTGTWRDGAPLLVTFTGPLANATLTVAGQSLGVSSLAAGESVTVDTLESTVLRPDGTTAYSVLTDDDMPTLPPLATTSVTVAGSGAGSVTVVWRDTWA